MSISADQILSADDLETREVDVPEWGGSVLVKALSGTARDEWEASLRTMRGKEIVPNTANARAKLVGRALVNADGSRMFADNQINALGQKSAKALDMLYEIVTEMSGIGEQSVKDAEGNSQTGDDGSTSSSPSDSDSPSPVSSGPSPQPS